MSNELERLDALKAAFEAELADAWEGVDDSDQRLVIEQAISEKYRADLAVAHAAAAGRQDGSNEAPEGETNIEAHVVVSSEDPEPEEPEG